MKSLTGITRTWLEVVCSTLQWNFKMLLLSKTNFILSLICRRTHYLWPLVIPGQFW
jgi:hypothetical protein